MYINCTTCVLFWASFRNHLTSSPIASNQIKKKNYKLVFFPHLKPAKVRYPTKKVLETLQEVVIQGSTLKNNWRNKGKKNPKHKNKCTFHMHHQEFPRLSVQKNWGNSKFIKINFGMTLIQALNPIFRVDFYRELYRRKLWPLRLYTKNQYFQGL